MTHLYYARLLISLAVASLLSTYLVLRPIFLLDSSSVGVGVPATSHQSGTAEAKQRQEFSTEFKRTAKLGNNLGLIGPVISCGRKKCLFPIASADDKNHATKSRQPSGEGYLITNGNSKQYQRAYDSWRYAKFLEYHYNIRQTLLGQPIQINVSENVVRNHLNAEIRSSRLAYKNTTRQFEAGPVVAQPVHIVSEPWILVGCYARHENAMKKLGQFISKVKDTTRGENVREQFMNNLEQDLNQTQHILKENEVQCLYHDFQLILDSKGKLHHMDLDRCLAQSRRRDGKGRIGSNDKDRCWAQMQDLVEQSRKHLDSMG